jgi:hypothetical protein
MPWPPHERCRSDRALALARLLIAATIQRSPGSNPQEQQERNTSVTSLTLNPALNALARATGKVVEQAARLSLWFFCFSRRSLKRVQ